jgi:hypothetical protein
MLFPPADVVRAAEPSPGVCLLGADRDLAPAEAGQRLRWRVAQELLQRQPEGPAAVLVRIAQLQPLDANRTRAASCRADDLTGVPAGGRPGLDVYL